MILNEVRRQELIDKSKQDGRTPSGQYAAGNQAFGKNRFERRNHSSISKSIKTYNRINMNRLYKKDILSFEIEVRGETDNYLVQLKLMGVLKELSRILKDDQEVESKHIIQAITMVFDHQDVYVNCTCPDFKYRFQHWSCVGKYASDLTDPGPGKGIANPNNDKGAGCKHVLLVLNNQRWIHNLALSVLHYIQYMKEKRPNTYRSVMYPKIYGHRFTGEANIGPKKNLISTPDIINQANQLAVDRAKFKPGNKFGMRFSKADLEDEEETKADKNIVNKEPEKEVEETPKTEISTNTIQNKPETSASSFDTHRDFE